MEEIFLGVWLAGEAIEDFKKKEIKVWHMTAILLLGIVSALCCRYAGSEKFLLYFLADCMPGFMLCLLSVLTRKGIGMGDALAALAIGVYRGIDFTLLCLCAAFFLASLSALFLCCVKKKSKTARLPFFPCLFAGYLLAALAGVG